MSFDDFAKSDINKKKNNIETMKHINLTKSLIQWVVGILNPSNLKKKGIFRNSIRYKEDILENPMVIL
jgi:acyl-ACP thioesterase